MFKPDDPLAPPTGAFDEPWQAQALALADTMITAGHVSAQEWAQTLGAALDTARASGADDTTETYFTAVLAALETLSAAQLGVTRADQSSRRADWEAAYRRTPHGQPVLLDD